MNFEFFLSTEFLMFLVALLSAIYSYRSWKESKKANDMSNLNALLSLRTHYKEKMESKYASARSNLTKDKKPSLFLGSAEQKKPTPQSS